MAAEDEVLSELEREGVKKPRTWQWILPWPITAAILWWVFRDVTFSEFFHAFQNARIIPMLAALLGFTVLFSILDAASYGLSFKWFVAPDFTRREMLNMRLGSYLLNVLYPPIITVTNVIYMRRHKGAPVTWTLSGSWFTTFTDIFVIISALSLGLSINAFCKAAPELDPVWLIPLCIPWLMAYVHFRYWFTDSRHKYLTRVTKNPLFRFAHHAQPRQHYIIYAIRAAMTAAGITAHWIALYSFGIEVPAPVMMVAAPLIVGGSFLPISGGGFGGPQLLALILLPYAGNDEAVLAAYSMSFSACFTAGRVILGAIFLPGFLSDLRDPRPRLTVDPLTGEDI